MSSAKNAFVVVLGLALLFVAYGCSGPLQVTYKPAEGGLSMLKEPVRVRVVPVDDARGVPDPRKIGKIDATIADMNATELVLSEEPARLVQKALSEELKAAGFIVTDAKEAELVLASSIKAFRLDVGGRDEAEIAIDAVLEKSGGGALWTGTFAFKKERYAGVMGNSRATLERLVNGALSSAIRKGVNGMVAEVNRSVDRSGGRAERPSIDAGEAAGTGRLVISSAPERAKVYIDEVYYGLTPLTLDIRPGIHDVSVGQKGFRDSKERVSVRSGETTELEAVLDKE